MSKINPAFVSDVAAMCPTLNVVAVDTDSHFGISGRLPGNPLGEEQFVSVLPDGSFGWAGEQEAGSELWDACQKVAGDGAHALVRPVLVEIARMDDERKVFSVDGVESRDYLDLTDGSAPVLPDGIQLVLDGSVWRAMEPYPGPTDEQEDAVCEQAKRFPVTREIEVDGEVRTTEPLYVGSEQRAAATTALMDDREIGSFISLEEACDEVRTIDDLRLLAKGRKVWHETPVELRRRPQP